MTENSIYTNGTVCLEMRSQGDLMIILEMFLQRIMMSPDFCLLPGRFFLIAIKIKEADGIHVTAKDVRQGRANMNSTGSSLGIPSKYAQ